MRSVAHLASGFVLLGSEFLGSEVEEARGSHLRLRLNQANSRFDWSSPADKKRACRAGGPSFTPRGTFPDPVASGIAEGQREASGGLGRLWRLWRLWRL